MHKEQIKKRFLELQSLIGVSGREMDVIAYAKAAMEPYADRIEVLTNGNLVFWKNGSRPGPTVLFTAHADEIGLVIKYISPDGFLYFERVGGFPTKALPARRVTIRGEKGPVVGVVGITPQHIQSPAEANSVPTAEQCYIDVGASSEADVLALGVQIGCTAVCDSPTVELNNPDLLTGRCADNRISCAVLIEFAKELATLDFAGTVCLAITVQEEVALLGGAQVSNLVDPDYSVVLDTFPGGGTPDVPAKLLCSQMGKGPCVLYCEGYPSAMLFAAPHPKLITLLQTIARDKGIPMQHTTLCEKAAATDISGISKFGNNKPAVTIATIRRYSHSPVEVIDLRDVDGVYELVREVVLRNEHVDLSFI